MARVILAGSEPPEDGADIETVKAWCLMVMVEADWRKLLRDFKRRRPIVGFGEPGGVLIPGRGRPGLTQAAEREFIVKTSTANRLSEADRKKRERLARKYRPRK